MHWLQVIIRRLQSVALHSKDWIKQEVVWMKDKHSFSLIWNNFVVVGLVLWLVLFRFHSSNEISLKSTFYAGERTDLSKLYKKLLAPPSCQKSNMSKWFGSGYSLQIKFLYWRIIYLSIFFQKKSALALALALALLSIGILLGICIA